MKKFLLKVLLFFACVVVMDFAFGFVFSWLRSHAKGGSTANCEYIANRATDDIIILGSSRATHHYIPQIIEDSLGMSCYNCGKEGNGIVLAYGRFKMLTTRYKPQIIIYEITPEYDYYDKDPNEKYLGSLRPYYEKQEIKEVFNTFGGVLEKYKMISHMYQNNSLCIQYLVDNMKSGMNNKGYSPLSGVMKSNETNTMDETKYGIDSLKYKCLQKFITESNQMGIPIVFTISPFYGVGYTDPYYYQIKQLCDMNNIPLFDFRVLKGISDNSDLFQDKEHLNSKGAKVFTTIFVDTLKQYYCSNDM